MKDLIKWILSYIPVFLFDFLSIVKSPLKHIRKQFHYARKQANINDVRFHDLRHTFASHYIMNGGDLLSLKQILGHSTLKMVERYAHLSHSHKQNMLNKLNYSDKNYPRSVTSDENNNLYSIK